MVFLNLELLRLTRPLDAGPLTNQLTTSHTMYNTGGKEEDTDQQCTEAPS